MSHLNPVPKAHWDPGVRRFPKNIKISFFSDLFGKFPKNLKFPKFWGFYIVTTENPQKREFGKFEKFSGNYFEN